MQIVFRLMLVLLLGLTLSAQAASTTTSSQPAPQRGPGTSYWGINAYLSKLERFDGIGLADSRPLLTNLTQQAGATWTLEELVWANIEPQNNQFNPIYDQALGEISGAGLNIIGMLITTPTWARDGQCSGSYFCPPANPAEFGAWAGWMAERYDGDGVSDAPGSPRIAAWQIWNEPNFPSQLPLNDEGQRRIRYGQMLVSAYQHIKAADPSAIVLAGGVYIFDGSQGLNFLNPNNGVFGLVPEAKNSFDGLAIHPYMPTVAPDSPSTLAVVSFEGRIRNTLSWLNSIGRAGAGLWITEVGWCTVASGECPAISEAHQAQYLIRAMVIAQHLGVQHLSWLQLEDAFDGQIQHPWRGSAMLHNYTGTTYPQKPAYLAYRTLATTLGNAIPAGTGPLQTFVFPSNPSASNLGQGTYDMRYTRGSTVIDVIWLPQSQATVTFPIIPGRQVQVMNRNGQTLAYPIVNNHIEIVISEEPLLIVQTDPPPPPLFTVRPTSLALLARPNEIAQTTLTISDQNAQIYPWTITSNAAWLGVTPNTGSTPATVTITAQAQTAPIILNTTITLEGSSNGAIQIPVQLRVTNNILETYLPITRK